MVSLLELHPRTPSWQGSTQLTDTLLPALDDPRCADSNSQPPQCSPYDDPSNTALPHIPRWLDWLVICRYRSTIASPRSPCLGSCMEVTTLCPRWWSKGWIALVAICSRPRMSDIDAPLPLASCMPRSIGSSQREHPRFQEEGQIIDLPLVSS